MPELPDEPRLLPPSVPDCVYCEDAAQVEVVNETRQRWSCYCNGCGKVFSVRKPIAVQLAEREARL